MVISNAGQELKKMQNEAVCFQMEVIGNKPGDNPVDKEKIRQWMESMQWFQPEKVFAAYDNKYHDMIYSEKKFEDLLHRSSDSDSFIIGFEGNCMDNRFGILSVQHNTARTLFYMRIDMKMFNQKRYEILETFERLFFDFHGAVGYLENNFDAWARSCLNSKFDLESYGFSTIGVEYSSRKSFSNGNQAINPHCLPWHVDGWNGITFRASYGMWFGPDYFRVFSEEKVASFTNCAENIDLGKGCRRIFLYDNIVDCNTLESRERQWAFRQHLDMCETIRKLNKGPIPSIDPAIIGKDPISDSFTEGAPFPQGGDRYTKVYIDANGKTCPRSLATGYMYVEYLNSRIIYKEKIELEK